MFYYEKIILTKTVECCIVRDLNNINNNNLNQFSLKFIKSIKFVGAWICIKKLWSLMIVRLFEWLLKRSLKRKVMKFYCQTIERLHTSRDQHHLLIKQQRNERHVQNYPLRLLGIRQPKKLWPSVEIVSTPYWKLLPQRHPSRCGRNFQGFFL